MIHFKDSKLIFIEVPKTGTSAICSECLRKDKSLTRNRLYFGDDEYIQLGTHDTAQQVLKLLDEKNIKDQKMIAFFRNPVDVLRSKYYFYKTGRAALRLKDKKYQTKPKQALNVFLANLLPLPLWCLLVPYTSNSTYVVDNDGMIVVDYLCSYSMIDVITQQLFVNEYKMYESFVLPKVNTSENSSMNMSCLTRRFLNLVIKLRLNQDMIIWRKLVESNGMITNKKQRADLMC